MHFRPAIFGLLTAHIMLLHVQVLSFVISFFTKKTHPATKCYDVKYSFHWDLQLLFRIFFDVALTELNARTNTHSVCIIHNCNFVSATHRYELQPVTQNRCDGRRILCLFYSETFRFHQSIVWMEVIKISVIKLFEQKAERISVNRKCPRLLGFSSARF